MPIRGKNGPWELLLHWAKTGAGIMGEKIKSLGASHQLALEAQALPIPKEAADRLRRDWRRILGTPAEAPPAPTTEEQAILNRVRRRTEADNRNNVTRTAAYLGLYRRHPELHWAFLAHMVSRNGGWSMTDLQGELLPRLLDARERRQLFLFLERANALIFQDAYPQLLLYEESKRLGRPLFHLLPSFHISAFMRPVWELFWSDRRPAALTVCLIINEQHYIEGRVVQNGFYQKQVLETLAFQTQSLLQLNQVIFPYRTASEHGLRLAGLVLEDFKDVNERIGIGKGLYGLLFGIPDILQGVTAFAEERPHTGSRSDYDPELFSPVKKAPPSTAYTERLDGCGLKPGAYPLYSPPLNAAWKDHPVGAVERYDWFRSMKAAELLGAAVQAPSHTDMAGEVCAGLHKVELAVLAAQAFGMDEEP